MSHAGLSEAASPSSANHRPTPRPREPAPLAPTPSRELPTRPAPRYAYGTSSAARRFEADLRRVARWPHGILITGETGTGKTWAARRIHRLSPRARAAFLELNCANLPENLVEAELFGYRKGAFTGADRDHRGLFEEAHGGILFLDEIGDLAPVVQNKLLKAIEEKQCRRVGGNRSVSCDVQVIAATSRNLPEMVRQGQFRADLLTRLAVLTLETVPLRQRPEDIPPMLAHFLEEAAQTIGRATPFALAEEAAILLHAYDYPGNIRTLRNLIYELTSYVEEDELISAQVAALVLAKQQAVYGSLRTAAPVPVSGPSPGGPDDLMLPWEICFLRGGETFPEWLARAKQRSIEAVMQATGGTLQSAAARLGVTRESLKGHWRRARSSG